LILLIAFENDRQTIGEKEVIKTDTATLRHLTPDHWWESGSAVCGVSLKARTYFPQIPIDSIDVELTLKEIADQGFSAIEIFAPSEGGFSYSGLDNLNYYRIDPDLGSMTEFRRIIRQAHRLGLAVITFENVGYCSVDSPVWLKACEDMKAGKNTSEVRRFVWSERDDAPAPLAGSFHMTPGEFWGRWIYSQRAKIYYWTKWPGVDLNKNPIDLPQYNWDNREWQEEAEKVIRFWMDTGLDGMIIDAPPWYANFTWETCRKRITDVIKSYGNVYIQAEGSGGGPEGPESWITEGGFNSIQDYGFEYPSDIEDAHAIRYAIEEGNPEYIEEALIRYHDRVLSVGGVLYCRVPKLQERQKKILATATVAFLGNLVLLTQQQIGSPHDLDVKWILDTKKVHPALHQTGYRRKIQTNNDKKYYAFLKTAADKSERILVVFNFQSSPQAVDVTMDGIDTRALIDLRNEDSVKRKNPLKVQLPAYGYRLFQLKK
jgi:glycosidase